MYHMEIRGPLQCLSSGDGTWLPGLWCNALTLLDHLRNSYWHNEMDSNLHLQAGPLSPGVLCDPPSAGETAPLHFHVRSKKSSPLSVTGGEVLKKTFQFFELKFKTQYFLFSLCMSASMCVCIYRCPRRPQQGPGSPAAGVTSDQKLPCGC